MRDVTQLLPTLLSFDNNYNMDIHLEWNSYIINIRMSIIEVQLGKG